MRFNDNSMGNGGHNSCVGGPQRQLRGPQTKRLIIVNCRFADVNIEGATQSHRILYPYSNSVNLFFIFSAFFKIMVNSMFLMETCISFTYEGPEKDNYRRWDEPFGYPLICFLSLGHVFKIVEMIMYSRMAYLDPKTRLLGLD